MNKTEALSRLTSYSGKNHVLFNGSIYLMEMIEKVEKDKFPFTTTIVEENKRYEFT